MLVNNPDQSVNTNTSIDSCVPMPVPTKLTDKLPADSITSLMIATAILLRAATGLIQVLLPFMRQKASNN
ncbi:hypothetical protein I8748_00390 [Nostoc sp. CENA67]|uniref:Uncharacterized protein n=1 Tax=Amazonocrinis nigriterrae CENA67 TaxID=2794033 RepID=A0A8J7L631_9NOST|nr:hypothetical protein [Amazonocrinis nigriterrae]MBH8560680.1 hypothetical protein [Amazonocrinis nigriterrae CENA67]